METVETVSALVQNLGFPIAAYAALFWYMIVQNKAHKEETDKLANAINANTLVIQKFLDKTDKSVEEE